MKGAEIQASLRDMGHTQASFAQQYRIPVKLVRSWVKDGAVDSISPILELMLKTAIEPPPMSVWVSQTDQHTKAADALGTTLQSMLDRAVAAGWPKNLAVAGAIAWLAGQISYNQR